MNISVEIIGLTLSTIGELLLAGTVLMVHEKLKLDKAIDSGVLKEINLERVVGILAIIMILLGYFFQINFFEHLALSGR